MPRTILHNRLISRLILLAGISILSVRPCFSQDTIKVLFVGNSFTYVFDLPGLFDSLAKGAGHPVIIAQHTPGGMSVGDTVQGTSAHMNNPLVYDLIRSNDWDYLLLQDNQGRFVRDYGVFPASSLVIEGHMKIRDSLLFYHPCAHMLWFAGWGPKAGYPPYASTGTGLIDKIYNNYRYLLDTAGQIIAPFGPAWQRIIANYPGINLWDLDNTHPGLAGSYLNACVLFSTVFKNSPTHSTFNPGLAAADDLILKNTAWETTVDSIEYTGLQEITPQISGFDNVAFVPLFDSCAWYLNNVLIHNGSSLNIPEDGEYYAIAKDANGCTFRTMTYHLSSINGINNPIQNQSIPVFYPNPANEILHVSSKTPDCKMYVMNALGQTVYEKTLPTGEINIDCLSWPAGLYVIAFAVINQQSVFRKLVISR